MVKKEKNTNKEEIQQLIRDSFVNIIDQDVDNTIMWLSNLANLRHAIAPLGTMILSLFGSEFTAVLKSTMPEGSNLDNDGIAEVGTLEAPLFCSITNRAFLLMSSYLVIAHNVETILINAEDIAVYRTYIKKLDTMPNITPEYVNEALPGIAEVRERFLEHQVLSPVPITIEEMIKHRLYNMRYEALDTIKGILAALALIVPMIPKTNRSMQETCDLVAHISQMVEQNTQEYVCE